MCPCYGMPFHTTAARARMLPSRDRNLCDGGNDLLGQHFERVGFADIGHVKDRLIEAKVGEPLEVSNRLRWRLRAVGAAPRDMERAQRRLLDLLVGPPERCAMLPQHIQFMFEDAWLWHGKEIAGVSVLCHQTQCL